MILSDFLESSTPPADQHYFLGTGKTADRLYSIIKSETRTEPLLATLFWQIAIRSRAFRRNLFTLNVSPASILRVELFVTPIGRGRFDLLVLDPARSADEPLVMTEFKASRAELIAAWETWRSSPAWQSNSAPREGESDSLFLTLPSSAELRDAVDENFSFELLNKNYFRIMLLGQPEMELTSCPPSSHIGVAHSMGAPPVSTVGVVATNSLEVVGVTTSAHAIAGGAPVGTKVAIGSMPGTVFSTDLISDSTFIKVDGASLPAPAPGFKGPLRKASPRTGPAYFDGWASGPMTAHVTNWSPDIPLVHPLSQLKVLTTPATAGGDSGCALVDDDGYLIGFSFFRTGLSQPVEFSSWIWAASVYAAHGLK